MAVVDTGKETSVIYCDPTKFQGGKVVTGGFGGQTILVTYGYVVHG